MISFKPLPGRGALSSCWEAHHFGLLNVNASSGWDLVIVFCCQDSEGGTRVVPFRSRVEMLVMSEKVAVFVTLQAPS